MNMGKSCFRSSIPCVATRYRGFNFIGQDEREHRPGEVNAAISFSFRALAHQSPQLGSAACFWALSSMFLECQVRADFELACRRPRKTPATDVCGASGFGFQIIFVGFLSLNALSLVFFGLEILSLLLFGLKALSTYC